MKMKRSERLIDMTYMFLERPHQLFSLNYFTKKYKSAKSSISEDLGIIKDIFKDQDLGIVQTFAGARGGVKYFPYISKTKQERYIDHIMDAFKKGDRILPGGYLYLTDIISDPSILKKIGLILASYHVYDEIDYILTVATKGISLAQALAYELGVPMIIARKESKVTEGPSISVKYTSKSNPSRVQTMEIGRDSMEKDSKVIIVDDFLRGGGSIAGLSSLVDIFECMTLGKYVLCENFDESSPVQEDVKSLTIIEGLDYNNTDFIIKKGSLFADEEECS